MNNPEAPIQHDNEVIGDKTSPASALTITITSGKGGVGKTNITTNLGIALAKTGKKVCVIDADTSLANINILLNKTPAYTLEHFLKENKPLDEILVDGPAGLKIVPSANGITDFVHLDNDQQNRLLAALEQLEQSFDFLLIDTAAGIGDSVIRFIQSAQYCVVVISPEPTSLTDAFSLVKVLKKRNHKQPIYVLVNMASSYAHSMEVFKRFAHAVNKYINTKVRYLGYIPDDTAVNQAVITQKPVTLSAPDSPAGRCISLLANILIKHFTGKNAPVRKISQFWKAQSALHPEHQDRSLADTQKQPGETEKVPISETSDKPVRKTGEQPVIYDNLSQEQAETLLADLIQFYLGEFGTLPAQAIDLALQAHAQGQLSDSQLQLVQQSGKPDSTQEPEDEPSHEERGTEQFRARFDELLAEAERNKQQLSELASYMVKRYRDIYNEGITGLAPEYNRFTPAHEPGQNLSKKAEQDTRALLSSLQFASIVDKKSG